jgi:hypothetical protein
MILMADHTKMLSITLGLNEKDQIMFLKPESAGPVTQFVRKHDNGDITPGLQSGLT